MRSIYVHPGVLAEKVRQRVAVGDPQGDVVEGGRFHRPGVYSPLAQPPIPLRAARRLSIPAGDRSRSEPARVDSFEMGRRASHRIGFAMLALVPAAAVAAGFPKSFAPMPHNPADRLADRPIEDYRYDHAKRCTRSPRAGTRGARSGGSPPMRAASRGASCAARSSPAATTRCTLRAGRSTGTSTPATRRTAAPGRRLIALLLAPDRAGNPHALARRMGVQEIIWDCRAWWSGAERPMRYSACYSRRGKPRRRVDATTAHRDHIHFGLNRMGAAQLNELLAQPLGDLRPPPGRGSFGALRRNSSRPPPLRGQTARASLGWAATATEKSSSGRQKCRTAGGEGDSGSHGPIEPTTYPTNTARGAAANVTSAASATRTRSSGWPSTTSGRKPRVSTATQPSTASSTGTTCAGTAFSAASTERAAAPSWRPDPS